MPLSRVLIASLALITASGQAHAQLQAARLVKDANRTPGDFHAAINWVVPLGNHVIFPNDTLAHGSELWISDGTAKGTRLLQDITPGPGGTYPEDPVAFGNDWSVAPRIAFRTQRDDTGNEMWVTNGTPAGTIQIYKSPTSTGNGEVRVQAGFWHGVLFENIDWEVDDATELLFSDGTVEGTRSLNPIGENGRRFSDPYGYLPNPQSCLFFANGNEIWSTNGYNITKRVTIPTGTPSQMAYSSFGLVLEVAVDFYSSELWLSKGQNQIERIDMPEGSGPARIDQMLEHLTKFYFIRRGMNDARELWTTDGTTAGTRKITLLNAGLGPESIVLGHMRAWSDAVYFAARNQNGDHELWRTDGTVEGTRRIASFTPPATTLEFYEATATDDFLYFHTADADGYRQLWRTKGDAASTRPVKGTPHISPSIEWPQMAVTEPGGVYFSADPMRPQNALWKLRGKTNGAIRLTKPEKTNATGTVGAPAHSQSYETYNGMLLTFVDTGNGKELWSMKPDGSGARSVWKPSVPLTDIDSTLGFHGITPHGVIFSLYDGADVRQVWITDGTRKGTRLLGDHGTANNGSYPRNFVKLGDTWYYSVVNHQVAPGASLWKTDGTPAGTTKIVAADGTAPGPKGDEMVVFNDLLYFFAPGTNGKTALWRSDGTAAGTVIVKDQWYNDSFQILYGLSVAGGELTFAISTSLTDLLWHSDGTTAGTQEVPYPHGSFSAGIYSPAVDLNGAAIFQGRKSYDHGVQLWRYDGDETIPLRDGVSEQHVYQWYPTSRMQAVAGNQLFYSGLDNFISELWVTDGTNAGTRMVKDINPGADFASDPNDMLAVGNAIYFTARDEAHGTELWRSDGTEAGTILIADIEPGPDGSVPHDLKVMNGKLYFTAQRRDIGRELFYIDLPQ